MIIELIGGERDGEKHDIGDVVVRYIDVSIGSDGCYVYERKDNDASKYYFVEKIEASA